MCLRGREEPHRAVVVLERRPIGAVAQWERITLAVWGSRVRIPPAPQDRSQLGWYRGSRLPSPSWDGGLFVCPTKSGRRSSAMTIEKQRTEKYDPATIEPKWQEEGVRSGLHDTPDVSDKPHFHFLTML